MDFLRDRTNKAIKRELRDILDSYHHFWDTLAELIQNARDAILRKNENQDSGPFFIQVTVDAASRTISVMDNGTGISSNIIKDVLAPGGTDKNNHPNEVGEKGVGLTYAIFSGSEFLIESKSSSGDHYIGKISNTRKWLDETDDLSPPPIFEMLQPSDIQHTESDKEFENVIYPLDSYTKITIRAIPPYDNGEDIFQLDTNQLKFLLSTRTAIGETAQLFDNGYESKFKAYYSFSMGGSTNGSSGELSVGHPLIHSYIKKNYSLDEVNSAFVTRADSKSRSKYLKDAAVYATKSIVNGDEVINVYGAMLPGNSTFRDLSVNVLRISEEDDLENYDQLFKSGIFLATKGMPTGVEIPYGAGGKYPAYYRRCFFLVESNKIKFDLGRKSMHWMPQRRLQKAVTEIFTKLEVLASYQSDERAPASNLAQPKETKAEREARKKADWKKYKGILDLGLDKISYQKYPNKQEAAVAAIFHEMLGAKLLKNYKTLHTGYGTRYDLHAHYVDPSKSEELELLIEFKYSLDSLINDLSEGTKYIEDIHLLIAWTADAQKLKDNGFDLDTSPNSPYEGVTHEISLSTPGIDPIPVILLEDLVKTFKT